MKIQLTATTPGVDFLDSSEVMKLISSKGYFKGSSKPLFSAIDGFVNCDLVLCALGGLIAHLSRLMVRVENFLRLFILTLPLSVII